MIPATAQLRAGARKPAAVRRAEILEAATVSFAETGLAGTGIEVIAACAGVTHPRIIQMFGTKRALFLEVVAGVFDRIEAAFSEARARGGGDASSRLVALGDAYRRLLQRDRAIALVMLHAYAAASDEGVREVVGRRYLRLQQAVSDITGADALKVRTFFATGLVITVSTALALPGRRTDATWGRWLLERVADDTREERENPQPTRPGRR